MASQILRRVAGSRRTWILSSPAKPSSLLPALTGVFSSQTPITATLIPGNGIGPEIAESVKQLVKNPSLFDVLVMPNLYGDIISELCAGLVDGLGLISSCNIGEGGIALAEAVHGSAPDIAGKNLANPTALLLSSVMMLRHLNLNDKADQIKNGIISTVAEGKHRTADLGGSSSTTEFTNAVCNNL